MGKLMIKHAFAAISLFAAFSAYAADIPPLPPVPLPLPSVKAAEQPRADGFQTYGTGMPLALFLKDVLGDMAHKPYLLAPDVAGSQLTVSADLSRYKKDLLPLVRVLLDNLGLTMKEVQGVIFIDKKRDADKSAAEMDIFVYHPKNRPAGSLTQYLNVFPDVQFNTPSGLSVKTQTPAPASQPGQALQQNFDSGSAAFSQFDKDPGVLIAKGKPQDLARLKKFLTQIDTPVPEVVVRAYLFEVRNTKHDEDGVSLAADILKGKLGITLGSTPSAATSGLKLNFNNITLAVNALASDSRVKLVSTSFLRAPDGSSVSSNLTTDVPTLGAIVTSNGTSSQSVDHSKAGKILNISPRIFENSIRVDISVEESSFAQTTTSSLNSPTKLERLFKSSAVAQDGETILLGGNNDFSETQASDKQFLFFGSSTKDRNDSQLVLMLRVDKV